MPNIRWATIPNKNMHIVTKKKEKFIVVNRLSPNNRIKRFEGICKI